MTHWAYDSVFYHIYPLGFCGAPRHNDFGAPVVRRLDYVREWIDHMGGLGVNALYLGPVFESTAHGYDTADYYRVDRRLGDNGTLAALVAALHARGIRVILDGVFNHVGRDFWAFRDLLQHGGHSAYRDWFHVDFNGRSPYGDPFAYEGWNGFYELVKLNLRNPAVKEHLFDAVAAWRREFEIDGLRLDVADCLDADFMRDLSAFCKGGAGMCSDFWLMGEVIHGDYRGWANPGMLDSVTNYECYKGLYSSLVDKNYFEIAYALNRQFSEGGLYCGLPLYNFVDNHDVNRVASNLAEPGHLYPLYCLLFTMPGVPSIYYGSEWGISARRNGCDAPLRPYIDLRHMPHAAPHPDLAPAIARLAGVRRASPALKYGRYRQVSVDHEQLAFMREHPEERIIVLLNAAEEPVPFTRNLPGGVWVDLLNSGERFTIDGQARIDVPPRWARILRAL